jgi:hypothetical protein
MDGKTPDFLSSFRDRCCDFFEFISPKHLAKKMALLTQNTISSCKKFAKIALVFEKNAIFRQILAKIATNCDHNIDPYPSSLKFAQLIHVKTSAKLIFRYFGPSF